MFISDIKGNINVTTSIIVFLVCILISLAVAVFHQYFYYPSKILKDKATEITNLFQDDANFENTAKTILNTRSDVAYLKLLDQNGVVKESFGNDSPDGIKKFSFSDSDSGIIIFGLKEDKENFLENYPLLWSLIIGIALSLLLIFLIFLENPKESDALKKLDSAMERVSHGDFTARVDVDSSSDEEIDILNSYQSFNRMVESLNKRFKAVEAKPLDLDEPFEEDSSSDFRSFYSQEENNEEETKPDVQEIISEDQVEPVSDEEETDGIDFYDKDEEEANNDEIIASEQIAEDTLDFVDDESDGSEDEVDEIEEVDENQTSFIFQNSQEGGESISEVSDETSDVEEEIESSFKPSIVLPDTSSNIKERDVVVFVAKISEFDSLSDELNSSDLSSFLTQYRKSASSIISDYGGVIEALLQDEIVAIFNAPDIQDKPELRSICAAVELLHELATMTKKRREEGKEVIAAKVGIGIKSLQFYTDSGIPDSVKNIVENARDICDNAELWKVYVSSDLHDNVREYVESKEYLINGGTLYSILGVEEGVVQL